MDQNLIGSAGTSQVRSICGRSCLTDVNLKIDFVKWEHWKNVQTYQRLHCWSVYSDREGISAVRIQYHSVEDSSIHHVWVENSVYFWLIHCLIEEKNHPSMAALGAYIHFDYLPLFFNIPNFYKKCMMLFPLVKESLVTNADCLGCIQCTSGRAFTHKGSRDIFACTIDTRVGLTLINIWKEK